MARKTPVPARLYVLAGVNGAGKSSIGGAAIRAAGGEYYNPDEGIVKLSENACGAVDVSGFCGGM